MIDRLDLNRSFCQISSSTIDIIHNYSTWFKE